MQDPKERRGYDEDCLKSEHPLTYGYLLKFEKVLRHRSGFCKYFCDEHGKPFAPFYSLYNIGDYTHAPYKVCWREQANFYCAIAGSRKFARKRESHHPRPQINVRPVDKKEEAHYVCGMLNSSIASYRKSYGVETQTSTHVLEYVRVPKFDVRDTPASRLAALSAEAHASLPNPRNAPGAPARGGSRN